MKMNYLRFIKLEFKLKAVKNFKPKGYAGNKLRGAIGTAMNKLFCDADKVHCEKCDEYCVYERVFKPVVNNTEFTTSPAPFVIEMSEFDKAEIKKGEELSFSIVVFGERVSFWNELLEAVVYSFEKGDKIFNASFEIVKAISAMERKVIWEDGKVVAIPSAALWKDDIVEDIYGYSFDQMKIKVKFLSPLLLKEDVTKGWRFEDFIDAVFYRIGSIIDLYEDCRFCIIYGLLCRKPYIKTEIISLKDNKPEFIIEGDLKRYLSYIEMGSNLHIGKKTTYGFGQYEYEIIE